LNPSQDLSVIVNGVFLRHHDAETLTDVGPGHNVSLENLQVNPGQIFYLALAHGASDLIFTASKGITGSPVMKIGVDSDRGNYSLKLRMVKFVGETGLKVKLNRARHLITFSSEGNKGRATFEFSVVKQTSNGNFASGVSTVRLKANQSVTFSYAT
jgi:hypothetical protein